MPSAQSLAEYDAVRPGTADWIVNVADLQARTEADAIRTKSRAEAFAMRMFAGGYVGLPIVALGAGLVMAFAGIEHGVIVAVLGGFGTIIDPIGRVLSVFFGRGTKDPGDSA